MSNENEDLSLDDVFEEPPRPPTPPPTFTTYHRKTRNLSSHSNPDWTSIDIQLVGHHVLWAQHLWNAAIVLADFLDERSIDLCEGKDVLELGAGGALPSLVASLCGARQVVITDYPDAPLIENITRNVDRNVRDDRRAAIKIEGYIWGTDPKRLLGSYESGGTQQPGFDLIILSDLIFNHSQHAALLDTCEAALRPSTQVSSHTEKQSFVDEHSRNARGSRFQDSPSLNQAVTCPCVLVFFSHHRPQYAARDLEFFALAERRGWTCQKVLETKLPAMFPDDPGDEQVRSTVHGWVLQHHVRQ